MWHEGLTEKPIWYIKKNGDAYKIPKTGESKHQAEIIEDFIRYLLTKASDQFGIDVQKAVISIPDLASAPYRKMIEQAALKADLKKVTLLSETAAAAITYLSQEFANLNRPHNLFVAKVGTGSMGFTIFTHENSNNEKDFYELVNKSGKPDYGSENATIFLVKHFLEKINKEMGKNLEEDLPNLRRLWQSCEKAKCNLTYTKRTK